MYCKNKRYKSLIFATPKIFRISDISFFTVEILTKWLYASSEYDDFDFNVMQDTLGEKKALFKENTNLYGNMFDNIGSEVKTAFTSIDLLRIINDAFAVEFYSSFSTAYTNIKYMITVNTWFNGYYIDLGSYLLDRIDTLAVESPKKINDNRYDEYYEFEIIDPKDICGGDDWDNFRVNVCHNVDNLEDLKGEESIINFTLYVYKKQCYFLLKICLFVN